MGHKITVIIPETLHQLLVAEALQSNLRENETGRIIMRHLRMAGMMSLNEDVIQKLFTTSKNTIFTGRIYRKHIWLPNDIYGELRELKLRYHMPMAKLFMTKLLWAMKQEGVLADNETKLLEKGNELGVNVPRTLFSEFRKSLNNLNNYRRSPARKLDYGFAQELRSYESEVTEQKHYRVGKEYISWNFWLRPDDIKLINDLSVRHKCSRADIVRGVLFNWAKKQNLEI